MKSAQEIANGSEWSFRPRAKTIVAIATREGELKGELKAADEIGELLTAEAERLMLSGEPVPEFWNTVQSWYRATREAAERAKAEEQE